MCQGCEGWVAGMAWRGMAWHGMAWHGMAWHGMQRVGATGLRGWIATSCNMHAHPQSHAACMYSQHTMTSMLTRVAPPPRCPADTAPPPRCASLSPRWTAAWWPSSSCLRQ
jgi:hypothetical protein